MAEALHTFPGRHARHTVLFSAETTQLRNPARAQAWEGPQTLPTPTPHTASLPSGEVGRRLGEAQQDGGPSVAGKAGPGRDSHCNSPRLPRAGLTPRGPPGPADAHPGPRASRTACLVRNVGAKGNEGQCPNDVSLPCVARAA